MRGQRGKIAHNFRHDSAIKIPTSRQHFEFHNPPSMAWAVEKHNEAPLEIDLFGGSVQVDDVTQHPTILGTQGSHDDIRRVAQDVSPKRQTTINHVFRRNAQWLPNQCPEWTLDSNWRRRIAPADNETRLVLTWANSRSRHHHPEGMSKIDEEGRYPSH